jgi:hypothetical protein
MSFDLEIKNSIASLQASVNSLTASVDKSQASLARMGTQAKVASAETFNVAKNLEKIGSTASVAGGPVAGLMTKLGGLAAFNPMALAAGAALGAITAGVYKLVDALKEANAEQERMAQALDPTATREAVAAARGKLDPKALRKEVAPEQTVEQITAAGTATARRWLADMPEWAQTQAQTAEAIGAGFVTKADRQAQMAAGMSMQGRAAARIERRQEYAAANAAEISRAAAEYEAGMGGRGISARAAISILESGKGLGAEEFQKNTEELRAMRMELKALGRNLLAGRRRSELEASIAEKSVRQLQLIEAHTMTQESSQ